jgi:hypothetical protein
MKANNNGWTLERRQRQAQLIHNWKPWKQSTGAITPQGKETAKMNAMRFTCYGLSIHLTKAVRARKLFSRGKRELAYLIMNQVDQYMNERNFRPIHRSPKAKYCKQWRKNRL